MICPLPAALLQIPVAHRALHNRAAGRPENSRAAILAAVEAGYGIEVDLQLSRDGVPMVFHDYELSRLTAATGDVRDKTCEELAAIPLRGGTDGPPTLRQLLELVAGRVPLLIEIKDQDGQMGNDVGPLERAVAASLEGYTGPVAVMSFNPFAISVFAEVAPQICRGLVTSSFDPARWDLPEDICARLREMPDVTSLGCSFISHEWRDLARPRVAEVKADGLSILCWTVKSPQEEAEARKIADNVTFEQYLSPLPS